MPQLAVIMDYREEQNCPSKPWEKLWVVPDDTEERDKQLVAMFKEVFLEGEDPDDQEWQSYIDGLRIVVSDEKYYGDLRVDAFRQLSEEDKKRAELMGMGEDYVASTSDHLLVTFVELPSTD